MNKDFYTEEDHIKGRHRKNNIGKISLFIIIINLLFLSVYLVGKKEEHDAEVEANLKATESAITLSLTILRDESVDESFADRLQGDINDMGLNATQLKAVNSYAFYITHKEDVTTSYLIDEGNRRIAVLNNDSFDKNVKDAVEEYLTDKGIWETEEAGND